MASFSFDMVAWASSPEYLSDILKQNIKPDLTVAEAAMEVHGWVRIGTAVVTVESPDESEIKLAAVQQCNEAIKKVRADTEVKVAHLEQMIQNLLAIEYTAPEEKEPAPVWPKASPDFTDVDDNIPF